jgi:hypothetical protein
MKQSQWILALVLIVAMVFGVTFALNYLGDQGSKPPPPPPPGSAAEVTFGSRMFPPEGVPPFEMEIGSNGSQEFWFVNDSGQTVTMGLVKTSCTCSEVHVFLAGADWKDRSTAVLAGQLAARAVRQGHGWLGVFSELALAEGLGADQTLRELTQATKGQSLTKNDSMQIPAGKIGWVQLKWDGARQAPQPMTVLSAEVWMGQRTAPPVKLTEGVRYMTPFHIASADLQQKLGEHHPLELPMRRSILVWSSTRDALKLEPLLLSNRGKPETDPFVVGKPVPLSRQECEKLEKDFTDPNDYSRVRCAYRIPVTIREKAEDGTLLDIGPFRRLVSVKLADADHEEKVQLDGTIQGDVYVGGSEDSARVNFNAFDSSTGSTKIVPVWSETPGLKLEVDAARTAPFLEVQLPEPEKDPSGKQVWRMQVKVGPNRVRGKFPRDDDSTYRDCAIYLRSSGPEKRTMRIAVVGIAVER